MEYWSVGLKSGNGSDCYSFTFDKIVKSRFKDWIPAFAGMTPMVSI